MTPRQHTGPLFLQNGNATLLQRVRFDDKVFNESWLQDVLFEHPHLLPIGEIEPVFDGLVSLGSKDKEISTPAGPIDLLCVNAKGYLTIVETKLWRNPESRREVVGQIIDYSKELAKWSYQDLTQAVRHAGGDPNQDPLLARLGEPDEGFLPADFIDHVSRNLQRGRFLLLIVGDGIQEGVEHMVEFLQKTPQLSFTLALVEMAVFRLHEGRDDALFVQPRIMTRTREVTRAVVEIKVPVDLANVEVTTPPERPQVSSTRKKITEDEFFEQLDKASGPGVVEFARWVMDNAEDHGLRIAWGDAGPMLQFVDDATGDFFTFGQLSRDGRLTATDRLGERFGRRGLPLEIYLDYLDDLAKLIPGASRHQFVSKSGRNRWEQLAYGKNPRSSDCAPLSELAPRKEEWFAAIDKAVSRIRRIIGES
jgi:hypothetical protein